MGSIVGSWGFGRRAVLGVIAGMGLAACGGGGGGAAAGNDFCGAQAKATCKKVFECTPPAMRDAFFTAFAGSSEAQCTSNFTQLCTSPPPAGETFDVNCSGGKVVDEAAKTRCLDRLAVVTCTEFNDPAYDDDCDQVCVAPGAAGAAGTTGGAGTGAGGSSGSAGSGSDGGVKPDGAGDGPSAAQLAEIETFCRSVRPITCDKEFQCVPATERDTAFTTNFGATVAECKTKLVMTCGTYAQNCATKAVYSATAAAACLQELPVATCDELTPFNGLILPPANCLAACFITMP